LGYPFGQKAYKLLNLETHQVFTSRDVIFHETILPYKHVSNNTGSVLFPLTDPHIIYYDEQQPAASTESHDQSLTPSLSRTENSSESTLLPVRRSSRLHKTPSYLTEYVCSNVLTQSSDIQTSHCSNTITSFCCNATSHASFNITSNDISQSPVCYSEPNSYEEAASKPEWQEAMQKEFEALRANNTWELVALPKGKKPISCKWVYKIKYKADGSLERCKARLVVRGFTQKEGVDYTETFSPVVKMTTIRSLIAVAVKKHWPIYQMDVNNAFLHGDLHEDIYMKPPQGLPVSSGNIVCKLKKSLYGLKQASRQWYAKLSDTLRSVGFQHSQNDYSLFCKQQDSCSLFVVVYVDDIIVTGNDPDEINTLKVFLDNKFRIKDLGELNYFLGMEVTKFPNGVALTQKKFAADLIKEFHCDRLPPTNCPLGPLCKSADEADLFADVTTYRKLVGKLNYLTNTRPDIAFSVQYLSQFLQAPTKSQWTATLHTLRYIKRDPSQGLFFNNSHDFNLTAYCDSDWAQCPCTRRSVSGYFIMLGGSPLSWKSKKQPTIALSSAEAEYRSMRTVTAELSWLTRLLSELQAPSILPVPLKCDSQAAIYIAKNPVFHERTKHIELDCHFVRTKLHEGLISVSYTKTTDQLADMFTKPLPGPQHHYLLCKLGVSSGSPSNLRGGVDS